MTRILAYITGILIFATLAWAAPQIQPLDMQGFKIFRLGAGTVASDAVRMDQAPTSVTVSGTGYISQTAANTWATRSITESSDGISITNGDGVSGNTVLAPAQNLAALEAIASTGHIVQTGSDTVTVRTQTGTTDEIEITNGSGVSGNPTYAFDGDVRAGWLPIASLGTMTYASATTFTIGSDVTSTLSVGDKLKLTNSTTKYFYVKSLSYSSPNTTVTVTAGDDYSLANAAITGYYSKAESPNGHPIWFNYTPTYSASAGTFNTVTTTVARFAMSGNIVHLTIIVKGTTSAAPVSLGVLLPVTGSEVNDPFYGWVNDAGTAVAAYCFMNSTSVVYCRKYDAVAFGTGANRSVTFSGTYKAG